MPQYEQTRRVKQYIAGVVEILCILACAITGDFHGCWLLSSDYSPLSRLYRWAVLLRWDDDVESHHTECPTCHFDRNEYLPRSQWAKDTASYYEMGLEAGQSHQKACCSTTTLTTTGGGEVQTFNVCGQCGTHRRTA